MKVYAVHTSERMVHTYQTAQCLSPGHYNNESMNAVMGY